MQISKSKLRKSLYHIFGIIVLIGLGALFLEGKSQNLTGTDDAVFNISDLKATAVSGDVIDYEEIKGESPLIVTSMATWCGSCIQNSVNLTKALEESGRDDVKVIAISVDPSDTDEKLINFQSEFVSDSWYVLASDEGDPTVLSIFGIQTIDQSFAIDLNGEIVDEYDWIRTPGQWLEVISKI